MPLRQYIIEYKAFLTLEKTLVKLDDLHRLHRLGRFRLMDGKPSTLNGNCFVRIPAPRQPCHLFGKSLVSDFVLLSATGWQTNVTLQTSAPNCSRIFFATSSATDALRFPSLKSHIILRIDHSRLLASYLVGK